MHLTSAAEAAASVVRRLRAEGHSAWWVGGCVRDQLQGIVPKDYDVATSATPDQVIALYPDAERVGAHFGVVLVKASDHSVEVSTYRSDHEYRDGRRPERVTFETDPRQDAQRRDFTINALFMDPGTGEVLDFFGGRQDLRDGVVRAIGDPAARFEEDYLRMLRAVRIAARFGFTIDGVTRAAIYECRERILQVTAERIREELLRTLTEGGARRGLELMDECGLLAQILPEIKAFQGVEQPPEFHPEGDVWEHVLRMLEMMGRATPSLALGVLLHDVGKPPTFRRAERIRFDGHVEIGVEMARRMLLRLRCSNELIEQVCALVGHHMRFKDVHGMKPSTLKRFLRLPDFDEHLELHRLDCQSSHGMLDNYEFMQRLQAETPAEVLRPARLLTGRDLIALGMEPGPLFSKILSAVEDGQLEGAIQSREQAVELALAILAHEPQQLRLNPDDHENHTNGAAPDQR